MSVELIRRVQGIGFQGQYTTTLTVPVRISVTPDSFRVDLTVYVTPAGKSTRLARINEVRGRFYHVFGGGEPDRMLIEGGTDSNGWIPLIATQYLGFPGEYKVWAKHTDSGAEVEKHFFLDANGTVTSVMSQILKNAGNEMPSDFT